MESEGNIFNPIFEKNVQGQKHPGSCKHLQDKNYLIIENLKVLFKK